MWFPAQVTPLQLRERKDVLVAALAPGLSRISPALESVDLGSGLANGAHTFTLEMECDHPHQYIWPHQAIQPHNPPTHTRTRTHTHTDAH